MKLVDRKDIKRLGIFFFYDKDGVVDEYVMYMLKDMIKNTSQNIIVCNGKLNEDGRQKFETLPHTDLLVRENKGFDVWAYKSALEYYGWDIIDSYDEIFMYNFTIMGPIGTFKTMFDDMDARDIDFWGMTIHNGAPFDPWGNLEGGMIPIHIQSHFIAVRNSMIRSEVFHKYWDERPMIKSYEDAVGLHEAIFTKTFEEAGFKWDVYVDTEDLVDQTFYPLFNMPVDLIKNRKCPIFKRKLLINDFNGTIQENANLCARELFDYLKNETDYDTDMIISHLLRSANLHDIVSALNLNYILDGETSVKETNLQKKYAAFISTVGWENHLKDYFKMILDFPENIDIYLLVDENTELPVYHKKNIFVSENNSLNYELLKVFSEKIVQYDVVCIIDEYGNDTSEIYSNALAAKEIVYRDMMENSAYVKQVMKLFEENEKIGMLVSNRPVHGKYYSMLENEWKINFKQISKLLKKCGLDVIVDKEKEIPIATANCCWIRTDILKSYMLKQGELFEIENKKNRVVNMKKNWSYLLPLFGQSLGYLTATISSKQIAQNLLNTFYQYAGMQNGYKGVSGKTFAENMAANYFNVKGEVYYDFGSGFQVDSVQDIHYKINAFCKEKVEIDLEVPKETKYIRFDPCEGFMCLCSNIRTNIEDAIVYNANGIRFEREDLFVTKDPQYIIEADFRNVRKIKIIMDNLSLFWNENGLQEEFDRIFKQREEMVQSIQYLTEVYNDKKSECEILENTVQNDKQEYERLSQEVIEIQSENKRLKNEISIMKNSRSWRWTAWLRKK